MTIEPLSNAPVGLLEALKNRRLRYTNAETIYHMVWNIDYARLVGVFGDGSNGAYEWFIWDDRAKTVRTSDCGYGCDCGALCCGLVESGVSRPVGDHDLFLTWSRDNPAALSAPGTSQIQKGAKP